MKYIIALTLLVASFVQAQSTSLPQVLNCQTLKETKLRIHDEIIPTGALAVTRDGSSVTLKEILADTMIFFKRENGQLSTSYQWMYNPIQPVVGRQDKYLSTSFGEDVIVTVGHHTDPLGHISVKYVGTSSGEYLSLLCTLKP